MGGSRLRELIYSESERKMATEEYMYMQRFFSSPVVTESLKYILYQEYMYITYIENSTKALK